MPTNFEELERGVNLYCLVGHEHMSQEKVSFWCVLSVIKDYILMWISEA
jgi:hypothetical protein